MDTDPNALEPQRSEDCCVVKPTDSQYFLDPNGAAEVHSFAFLQLVVMQYISIVTSYIEMPERYYLKYCRGFMAFFGLVSCVFTIAVATNYRPNTFEFLAEAEVQSATADRRSGNLVSRTSTWP